MLFGNWDSSWYPIDRACGSEHERQRSVVDERLQQCRGAASIVAIIRQRLAHRLPDIGKGREVHHRRGLVPFQHRANTRGVSDIALLQRPPFHRPAVAAREVVIGNRFEAPRGERFAGMAADIARAAGDENFQGLISRHVSIWHGRWPDVTYDPPYNRWSQPPKHHAEMKLGKAKQEKSNSPRKKPQAKT